MNKAISILPLALLVTACGKTELVPQLYMPTPPAVLMEAPKELNTIKQEPKEEKKADDKV
jgi:hypothetical protein